MSDTNNPSAFPSTNHGMIISTGITLRDYFAAKAMLIYFGPDAKVIKNDPDSIASWCYLMADSMLKARER